MDRRLVQTRLRRDQALWARVYILKSGRSRLKENPLLGEVPGCKPYVYCDFYPFIISPWKFQQVFPSPFDPFSTTHVEPAKRLVARQKDGLVG